MSGFDFDRIADKLSAVMDTDSIDVWRITSAEPDRVLVCSDVKCHIEMQSADNPNPVAVDVPPIIQSLRVHMPTWVDIRNNDFVVAKKMDSAGNVIITYRGVCGFPAVDQARQSVLLTMNAATSPEEPPAPPLPVESPCFRLLVNGLFTQNDGSSGFGFHLFKRIPFTVIATGEPGNYTIETSVDRIEHPEMGTIQIWRNSRLRIYPTDEWVTLVYNPVQEDGVFKFSTFLYTPTEQEAAAYETSWYDD